MTFVGSFLQFLWHLFSISARVLALSLFATAYPRLIAVVGAAHWIVMVLWVLWQDTGVCNSKVELLFLRYIMDLSLEITLGLLSHLH